jgi:hypothetical protein
LLYFTFSSKRKPSTIQKRKPSTIQIPCKTNFKPLKKLEKITAAQEIPE